jgi:hypothetical protein
VSNSTLGGEATILNAVIHGFRQSLQTSTRMMHRIKPRWPAVGGPVIIISNLTPSSHNRDPEYCILSQERNSVRKNPQDILVPHTFAGPHLQQAPTRTAVALALAVSMSLDTNNIMTAVFVSLQ